jgi:hypothetical protein
MRRPYHSPPGAGAGFQIPGPIGYVPSVNEPRHHQAEVLPSNWSNPGPIRWRTCVDLRQSAEEAGVATDGQTFPQWLIDRFAAKYREAASKGRQCMGSFVDGMKGLFGDHGFQTHKGDDVIAKVLPRLGSRRLPVSSAVAFQVDQVDGMGEVKYRGEARPSRVIIKTVGPEMGWSVFALSIGGGYHVACVLLDTRDRQRDFYWFDQIARGQVTAERVDEKILQFTQQVVDKREPLGKGYDLSLGIDRIVPHGGRSTRI